MSAAERTLLQSVITESSKIVKDNCLRMERVHLEVQNARLNIFRATAHVSASLTRTTFLRYQHA